MYFSRKYSTFCDGQVRLGSGSGHWSKKLDPDLPWNQCGSTILFCHWFLSLDNGTFLNSFLLSSFYVMSLRTLYPSTFFCFVFIFLWAFCLFPSCILAWKWWIITWCCAFQSYIYVKSPTEENAIANEILKLPNSSLEVDKPVKVILSSFFSFFSHNFLCFGLIFTDSGSVSSPLLKTDPIQIQTKTKLKKKLYFFWKPSFMSSLTPYNGRSDSSNVKFLNLFLFWGPILTFLSSHSKHW